jgi:uncharacterized protein (TIGR02271 family)
VRRANKVYSEGKEAYLSPLPEAGSLVTAAGRGQFRAEPEAQAVLVTLAGGRQFHAPVAALTEQPDGEYFLNMTLSEIQARLHDQAPRSAMASTGEELVVPVVAEELVVDRRAVETGRVRVTKTVHEQSEEVETLLERDEVEMERIPVNEFVDATVPIEYEGDRVIIPIYEEVAVVEKRLLLKEKLVLTRRQVQERQVQPVTRRMEEAVVERLPGADAVGPDA